MPFCILIGAMTCYLDLSRRLELVVARAAGISAWQFLSPALAAAAPDRGPRDVRPTIRSPPTCTSAPSRWKRRCSREDRGDPDADFWINQISSDGQAILSAAAARNRDPPDQPDRVPVRPGGEFKERIEAREAALEPGRWRLRTVRRYTLDSPPELSDEFMLLATNLTPSQVRNTFSSPGKCVILATPALHPVLPGSGIATAGYRLQYQKLLCAAISAGRDGHAGGCRQPAVLPVRRRAEDGFEWRGCRLSALCPVEGNGGFEQGRVDVPGRCGVAARLRGRPHRFCWPCCTRRTGSGRCRRPPV